MKSTISRSLVSLGVLLACPQGAVAQQDQCVAVDVFVAELVPNENAFDEVDWQLAEGELQVSSTPTVVEPDFLTIPSFDGNPPPEPLTAADVAALDGDKLNSLIADAERIVENCRATVAKILELCGAAGQVPAQELDEKRSLLTWNLDELRLLREELNRRIEALATSNPDDAEERAEKRSALLAQRRDLQRAITALTRLGREISRIPLAELRQK